MVTEYRNTALICLLILYYAVGWVGWDKLMGPKFWPCLGYFVLIIAMAAATEFAESAW